MFQYILFGFVVIDLLMSCGIAGVALQYLDRQDTWAIFFLGMFFFPICPLPWIIEKLSISANIDNARQRHYDFILEQKRIDKVTFDEPEVEEPYQEVLINTPDGTQRVSHIHINEWAALADILVKNNYEFKSGIGRRIYEKFRPVLTRNVELANVNNNNVVELTTSAKAMFNRLHQLPRPIAKTPVFMLRMVK